MANSRFDDDKDGRKLRAALKDQMLLGGSEQLINEVAKIGTLETFKKGDDLLVQDDEGDDVYLIVSGSCEVIINGRRMATRGPGHHVGEMAAIEPTQNRSATIRALEKTEALKLTSDQFADLGERYPILYLSIARTLSKRLRERNKHVGRHHSTSKVLLISSTESLGIAEIMQEKFEHDKNIIVDIWKDGVFRLSDYTLESLERKLAECDFGVAIATGDDIVEGRNKRWPAPRDNVIFELAGC